MRVTWIIIDGFRERQFSCQLVGFCKLIFDLFVLDLLASQRLSHINIFILACYSASISIYPNNFDLMEKKESKMFKFIRKALDLARKREVKAAANVLTRIAKCVVHGTSTVTIVGA